MPGNIEISLNAYVQHFLSQPGIEVRSANLTTESVISVAAEVYARGNSHHGEL